MEPMIPLVICVGPLVMLSLYILWLLNREDFPFEPLIAALGALIVLILLLDLQTIVDLQAIDFWLSLLLVIVGVTVVSRAINQRPDSAKRWRVWIVIVSSGLGIALLFWNDYKSNINIRGVTVTVMLSTETKSDEGDTLSIDARISALWEKTVATIFEKETGAKVDIIASPSTPDQRLKEYYKRLAANNVDVYAIDVTWPVVLAPYWGV
jgi:amino acid transporter